MDDDAIECNFTITNASQCLYVRNTTPRERKRRERERERETQNLALTH